jgi:hypothetical protein
MGGPGRPAPPVTYTHALFECPAFSAAKDWLLDLWQHVGGARPPDSAAAVVADQPGAWPAGQEPTGDLALLWQALRLTLLHSVWAARFAPEASQRTARAAVSAAIEAVRSQVRTLHGLAHMRQQYMAVLPARTVTQQQQRYACRAGGAAAPAAAAPSRRGKAATHADRLRIWLRPGLAALVTAPGGGPARLELALSLEHPVPAPP